MWIREQKNREYSACFTKYSLSLHLKVYRKTVFPFGGFPKKEALSRDASN
ncbi:hypothetical protein B4098_2886 [Heyndrickxia coagulans]|uniref:Uncharacterized protein n=1 Tax=Heyndrickxia coagulans TaxID=1398 RepID=A0A150K7B8_HEYCO|nr:hypothetical protein B4098_2886 [Heyndrickxia coagulans]